VSKISATYDAADGSRARWSTPPNRRCSKLHLLEETCLPLRPGVLDTHATISRATRTSVGSFARTISWSFRIGNDGYNFLPGLCTKDTEATDGLGLPGHHGCGNSKISATVGYLG
jgi:hypothetical protein